MKFLFFHKIIFFIQPNKQPTMTDNTIESTKQKTQNTIENLKIVYSIIRKWEVDTWSEKKNGIDLLSYTSFHHPENFELVYLVCYEYSRNPSTMSCYYCKIKRIYLNRLFIKAESNSPLWFCTELCRDLFNQTFVSL